MVDLLILLIFYILFVSSVFGYGFLFTKVFNINTQNTNYGLLGIYGVYLIIFISYLTSIFFAHSFVHNIIFHFIGIFFFIFLVKKKIFYDLKYLHFFLLLFIFHILIFKNHDDFSYYHFPYTYYLTEFKTQLGVGIFNHGFRTPSSIFYLNSIFYLPYIGAYSFNFGAIIIFVISNLYFLHKIHLILKKNKNKVILYFSLLSLGIINIFFYRISEHGTDRSAQILILILISELMIFINNENGANFVKKNFESLVGIFCLLFLIISLKAFYILYVILLIPLILKIFKNRKFINIEQFKNIFLFCIVGFFFISFIFFSYFSNTGCIIYPLKNLCFENVIWAIDAQEVVRMNNWYQLWSKGGASPNFRVDDPDKYIQGFNWVNGWFENYFFNKVSDFILGLLLMIAIFFGIFFDRRKVSKDRKKNYLFSIILIILFLEWFYNHPALRYGGYVVISLLLLIPFSSYLTGFYTDQKKFKKKVIFTIILIFFISISRNLHRIHHEFKKYNYNIINTAFYSIEEPHMRISEKMNYIINNKKKCDLSLECIHEEFKIVEKYNRYIFYKLK
tara:strand:+ start:1710 stop:3395 length:1686 start_codon:yes stop_codon:yes gene_type:complete